MKISTHQIVSYVSNLLILISQEMTWMTYPFEVNKKIYIYTKVDLMGCISRLSHMPECVNLRNRFYLDIKKNGIYFRAKTSLIQRTRDSRSLKQRMLTHFQIFPTRRLNQTELHYSYSKTLQKGKENVSWTICCCLFFLPFLQDIPLWHVQ